MTVAEALRTALEHHQAGRLAAAEELYRQILAVEPNQADAWNLLGITLRALGRANEAVACYRQTIQLKPDFADAHNNLGNALTNLGQLDEAVACYRRAIQLRPDFADAHNNLGNALTSLDRADEAVVCCRRAIELRPDFPVAHNNLGIALRSLGRADEAIACYRRAIRLKPDFADAHNNLGNALTSLGQFGEAADCYRLALYFKSTYYEAYCNLGTVLLHQRKLEEADSCYKQALQLKPDAVLPHLSRSALLLVSGDFAKGWPEYEYRLLEPLTLRHFSQPRWDGASLEGRTILLYSEQGLGDTIHFVRYTSMVKQRGGTVLLECPPALVPLLKGVAGVDSLLPQGLPLPEFQVQAPLLSLPGIFGTTLESIPAPVPYVFASPATAKRWRNELVGLEGFKVGIVWQGRRAHKNDRHRSVPLMHFAPLADVPGVRLVSLQVENGTEQLRAAQGSMPVLDLGSRFDTTSFADVAALVHNLDLVVSVDTAIAHLAGAMGVPVWVALAFAGEWRWLLERSDSPWYPTMRLFRQGRWGDWTELFERMAAELRRHIDGLAPTAIP